MKRTYGRRNATRGVKPSLQWNDISATWVIVTATSSTAVAQVQIQAPASLANLTSDPPEDLIIKRIVGDFATTITTTASAVSWTLGLMVQDTVWTPGATFLTDNDKRVLWHQTYETRSGTLTYAWDPPGQLIMADGATVVNVMAPERAVHVDITPNVRVEAGKALYLVAWENTGVGSFTTSSRDMRLLMSRARRR